MRHVVALEQLPFLNVVAPESDRAGEGHYIYVVNGRMCVCVFGDRARVRQHRQQMQAQPIYASVV
jgi:hypothetical protein